MERYRREWSGTFDKVVAGLGAVAQLDLAADLKKLPSSILQPLSDAVGSADRIAQHDLSQLIEVRRRDETSAVMRGVLAMQRSLSEVFSGVRNATDSVPTAAREVAVGSQNLSRGIEQAAANLQ